MNGNPARLTELPELDFICTVNPKRKKDLKASYESLAKKYMVRYTLTDDILEAYCDWVSHGNDPACTNRYGFFDSRTQKYLDFFTGEFKALSIVEIMLGCCHPAKCLHNEFGEPRPVSDQEYEGYDPHRNLRTSFQGRQLYQALYSYVLKKPAPLAITAELPKEVQIPKKKPSGFPWIQGTL